MTQSNIAHLIAITNAFYETVKAAGAQGAVAGHLYAAAMSHMSLDHFEKIMMLLVRAGKVEKRGQVYYAV